MLWFLTGEMPVYVLHISSFHLSNVKSEQKKKKTVKHNTVHEKKHYNLNNKEHIKQS